MNEVPMLNRHLQVSGAPNGYDALLMVQKIKESSTPILHVSVDDRQMAVTRDAIKFFAPDTELLEFPAWDCPPYSRISPNRDVIAMRMDTLAQLADQPKARSRIVLTTVNAVLQRVPSRQFVQKRSIKINVGEQCALEKLTDFLNQTGYERASKVYQAGEYSVRGGIVDVFPAGESMPVRIDFFGDQIDGIRCFDPESQLTVNRLQDIRIGLGSEFTLDTDTIKRFRHSYRSVFGIPRDDQALYAAVSNGQTVQGLEHWLPFLQERLELIFDFLPGAQICLDHRVSRRITDRWESVNQLYSNRQAQMQPGPAYSDAYPPVNPECLYASPDEISAKLNSMPVQTFVPQRLPTGYACIDAGGRAGHDFSAERVSAASSLTESLADHIRELRKSKPVILACLTEGSRQGLASMLQDAGLSISDICSFDDVGSLPDSIDLAVLNIDHGFTAPDFAVVSEQDVFGASITHRPLRRRSSEVLLAETDAFSAGDLVVHEEHGIGRYLGLQTIVVGAPHDCLALEYAGNTRLYLPVINIDLLTKFGSNEAQLDRLGAAHWQQRKARIKNRLKDIADELIKVAAKRSVQRAPILIPDGLGWESFISRFQHMETEDQVQAIADVLADLASGIPMDRLICGDVGFGKTEVAMRAAFITALAGHQVALVAPTTLLVNQHFNSFRDRFAGFPIIIKQLSRLSSTNEAAATRKMLKAGTCDIVIGTHALLAKSIGFKSLGLLIIDEEQSFGVVQKEHLKKIRGTTHVLSMTATPIPRTMQLALSGVRELSIIATPPVNRLAIRTYVAEFDPVTVRTALLHEFYRGGQSFIVVPRVKDLDFVKEFLQQQVPEVTFVVAHGQMPSSEMEKRTGLFYNGSRNVLVSTTIIAAGLDIPSANTIIIMSANRFGLAQLYQIRGRVGRSAVRAYAYITYMPKVRMTDHAHQRLQVISNLDSLGAGFSLAARDLDMRGSGNLLGEAQKGHVREVGVELYHQMLEAAVNELKSSGEAHPVEQSSWAPQINLGIAAYIPEIYVEDLSIRLGLYRRMGLLRDSLEITAFAVELVDRFGKLPNETRTLLRIIAIKQLCKQAGISRLDAGKEGAAIGFLNDTFNNPTGLLSFITDQKDGAKVKGNKLIVRRKWENESERLDGLKEIVKEIARLAN